MYGKTRDKILSWMIALAVVLPNTAFADTTGVPTDISTNPSGLIPIGMWDTLGQVLGLIGVVAAIYALIMFVKEHFVSRNSSGALKHVIAGALVAMVCFGAFGILHFIVAAGQTTGSYLTNTTVSSS